MTDSQSCNEHGAGGESSPMAMGMAMARKTMAQMGHGGSPMEMMQCQRASGRCFG
jgi:hypothetical protein